MAILTGNTPDKNKMQFIYGKNGDMSASNILGEKMWLQDGIVIGDKMYLTGYVFAEDWTPQTINLITIPIVKGNPDLKNYTVEENVPLLYKNGSEYTIFGIGIMNNNSLSGALKPDGYIYVYGYKCGAYAVKKLVAARVLPQDFGDISKWRYWNGKTWSADIKDAATDAAALSDNMISAELSVTPVTSGIYKGKYMLVYTPGGIGNQLAYSIGDSPIRKFTDQNIFYTCREKQIYSEDMKKINGSGSIICYNAKAHPSLSKDGELLVSYNVNILGAMPTKNQYYRPRFVTLKLNELRKDNVVPQKIISTYSKVTVSDNKSAAGNVTDGNDATKWTSTAAEKWMMLDMGSKKEISRFMIRHAGSNKEYTYLNTKAYKVQYSLDGRDWKTLYEDRYSYENITDKVVNTTAARYVKLIITVPTQSSINKATIYSFDLYGK
jgi:hypothetical protein